MDNFVGCLGCFAQKYESLCSLLKRNRFKTALITLSLGYVANRICNTIYKRYKHYPPGPYGYPVVGNFLTMLYHPIHIYHQMALQYGPIMTLYFFDMKLVLLNDSKIIKQLLTRKDFFARNHLTENDKHYSIWNVKPEPHKKGIFPFIAINYKEWEQRRKHSQSALFKLMTAAKVTSITQKAINNTLNPHLLNVISNDDDTLWYPRQLCEYLAMNTIFECCFAKSVAIDDPIYLELSALVDETFRNSFTSEFFVNLPILRALLSTKFRELQGIRDRRNQIIEDFINERQAKLDKEAKGARGLYNVECFIDSSLNAKLNGALTHAEIVADTYFMFAAGTDTTSSTLEFGVVLAAKYPEVVHKVRNELMKHHQGRVINGFVQFNLKRLNRYPLFRAFIHEVLRVSSVVPIGVEHSNNYKDVWIEAADRKYCIPKGSRVHYNVAFVHKWSANEHWIQNGDEVCLDNWLVYDKNGDPHFVKNESFVSFGVGRRDCVGRLLAVKELAIIFGHLILNYELSLQDKSIEIKANMNITSVIDPPIPVEISRVQID
eukprot:847420_1